MSSNLYTITYGGWYQRTTLHLSEVHGFLNSGYSKLPLNKEKLHILHSRLNLASITRVTDYFEYIEAKTKDNITIKYFEDGLYILTLESKTIAQSTNKLNDYFKDVFEPALAYIFSLGAPTPKILANIQTNHPFVITKRITNIHNNLYNEELFGKPYQTISSNDTKVYKTDEYIVIYSSAKNSEKLPLLVEMQIFFREFKDQLEKYLSIHRLIWEQITTIKEQKSIQGVEVEEYRSLLDGYKKTIDLISNRINQMGSYVGTRASIAKKNAIESELSDLFQYRFEVLTDTLGYIKEIWNMTDKYLSSAIQNIIEIKNQTTSRNITSLQVITTAGVVAGIVNHLTRTDYPTFTFQGILFFIVLLATTWVINYTVLKLFQLKSYNLTFGNKSKKL